MISEGSSNAVYEAGAARVDVTPPVGIRLIGYAVREGVSLGVDEPLTLTALALRSQGTTIVLISLDACLVYIPFARKFREQCAQSIGISAEHILLNFSHTHAAPATDGYMDYDTPEQLDLQADFRSLLLDRGEQACRKAIESLQPARLSVGWGECHANINRRQQTEEHGVLLGEDPLGPCDRTVGVIRVDDLSGSPLAVAYRYSCHTVTVGPKTNLFSPDFVGPARRLIEGALSCPSLFLQGCAGNINPITGIGQDSDGDLCLMEDKERIGHMLGGEVLKVAQSLRTHRRRKDPILVQSVAIYWLFEYEDVAPGEPGTIEVNETVMEQPLVPFPSLQEVRTEREAWAEKLRQAQAKGEREWVLGPLVCFDAWAERRLAAAENGPNPLTVKFPVQTIRIGDIRIVALPFETMTETGLELRESLGADTFVLGYTNGMVSYLPTPQISEEGGMEAKLAYQACLLPSELPGDWEPRICEQVKMMFQQKT